jgi:hypothetical protein
VNHVASFVRTGSSAVPTCSLKLAHATLAFSAGGRGSRRSAAELGVELLQDDLLRVIVLPDSTNRLICFFCWSSNVTPTFDSAVTPFTGSFSALPSWIADLLRVGAHLRRDMSVRTDTPG